MNPYLRAASRPTHRVRRWAGRLACVLAVGLCGCRGVGRPDQKYDLLTAELRTREREIEELRAETGHLRLLTQTYQRQTPGGPAGTCVVGPSYHGGADAAPAAGLRAVDLGAGTGGVDDDGRPGDESLMVVVVPRDDDNSPVKVPARLTVTAFEVSRQGQKSPIGTWEVPADQLRRTWRSGLLSSGYFVPLQWDTAPGSGKVRIAVRLVTADGREYEADKDVTVRPLPGIGPHALPAVTPELPPPGGATPELPELPPPAGLPAARLLPAKPAVK